MPYPLSELSGGVLRQFGPSHPPSKKKYRADKRRKKNGRKEEKERDAEGSPVVHEYTDVCVMA